MASEGFLISYQQPHVGSVRSEQNECDLETVSDDADNTEYSFGIDRVIPCQKATEKLVKLSQINFYVENQTGTKNLKTFDFLRVKKQQSFIFMSQTMHTSI